MAWRYGAAAVVGYAVFLVSLRVWLAFQGRQTGRAAHALDFLDGIPTGSGGGGSATVPEVQFGGGGGFSGGGGGASFDAHGLAPDADVVHVAHGVSLTEHLPDIAGDLGEGAVVVWPVLLVVCAIGVAVISAGAVVVEAPTLLAELLFDGVIAGVAYRRLRNVSTQHWLTGAVRRTVKPVLVLTLTLVACALIAQWLVPGARSIGDFFR
jgi:phosphotransferase system  glucose/maltose/N-acetylglucosamine-specific IIC component